MRDFILHVLSKSGDFFMDAAFGFGWTGAGAKKTD